MGRLITINVLKDFMRIPSITGDAQACKKIIKLSQLILNNEKITSKILHIENKQMLIWGECDITKTRWLVNSHLDVVLGKIGQFEPIIKDGKIWGRGSADTKSSAAVLLTKASDWNKIAINKNITFMLVTDEEIGGNSTKQVLEKMKNLKGAVFLEPTDEKIITQAKGIMQIKIHAAGKACHGSRPWDGTSALELITNSLVKFRVKHPIPTKETRNTTFNFSILNSGNTINRIPDEASLWCDVRWNPNDNPQTIIKILRNDFKNSKIEIVKLESPVNCSTDSYIFKSFSKAVKMNKISSIPGFEHGSSDARHCTAKKIPAIVFGPKGRNLHADDEWVSLKSLERISNVLDSWIRKLEVI